jgi:hypothetical protein
MFDRFGTLNRCGARTNEHKDVIDVPGRALGAISLSRVISVPTGMNFSPERFVSLTF